MMVYQFLLFYLITGLGGDSSPSNDHVLKHHFKMHSQDSWNAFESLTAKGEWHSGTGDYLVDYYIKQPNRWSAVGVDGRAQLISNGLYAGSKGIVNKSGATAFLPEEALALSFTWNFGSPLYPIVGNLTRKQSVQVDQKPCNWYQYSDDNYVYDFFISKSDHLFYKASISKEGEEVLATTTIAQYRRFGPYQMPSQVMIKTENIEYLMVFTDYVIGDYVSDTRFYF
jgi:hypothetical protein